MERLLIFLAVLTCATAAVAVLAMAARARRPSLRMDSEFDEDDEHLLLGLVGAPESPIDRSAQVIDAQVLDLEPIEPPRRSEVRAGPDRLDPPAVGR